MKRQGNVTTLCLFVPPVPASRPRVTRWGTYYGKTYKAYREAAHKAIPAANQTYEGNLHANVEFVCHRPKTTKRINPKGDVDNHVKAILDAITGTKAEPKHYWRDDDQVVTLNAHKRFADEGEEPHTRIEIHPA